MKKLLTPIVISLLLLTAVPTKAKNLQQNHLENTKAVVSNSLILKGINAYQLGNYQKAIQLLNNSLSRRKVIVTPREIAAFNYLAMAYQEVGKESLATNTIVWAKSFLKLSPIESAHLENTAGKIAYQQNKKLVANKHWEKARQLYLAHNIAENWVQVTLSLANNYRELGNVEKYQQLIEKLETVIKLDTVDYSVLKDDFSPN